MTARAATAATVSDELERLFQAQKAAFRRDGPPDRRSREATLDRLRRVLLDNRDAFCAAVSQDFGHRSPHETLVAELYPVVSEIRKARRKVGSWMKPRRVGVSWAYLPGRSRILHQPLGVVGIVSPWNYPIHLTFSPLVAALAAGNRAMIKPSEAMPRTSDLIARLIAETFPADQVTVVTGGAEVAQHFVRLPFDHLLFTGSTRVGRLVVRAAAENLTPVTLELGGKSPSIVGSNADLATAARSIAIGKLLNAGQTCIAPDYALVPADRVDGFVQAYERAVRKLYPTLAENPDYTAIVNDAQYARLQGYLTEARARGAVVREIRPDGETPDPRRRKLAPTLVLDAAEDLAVMRDEIFGPILPVVAYRDIGDAIAYVNGRPRPLALYFFGRGAECGRVLNETVAGGVTVNDTLLHIVQDDLPFGGVGESGMGHYHGIHGFETFSTKKAVFHQSPINGVPLMHPPFGRLATRMIHFLLGK